MNRVHRLRNRKKWMLRFKISEANGILLEGIGSTEGSCSDDWRKRSAGKSSLPTWLKASWSSSSDNPSANKETSSLVHGSWMGWDTSDEVRG